MDVLKIALLSLLIAVIAGLGSCDWTGDSVSVITGVTVGTTTSSTASATITPSTTVTPTVTVTAIATITPTPEVF